MPVEADLKQLEFVAEEGFDFVRIPCDYKYWTDDFDYYHPKEEMIEYIDRYIEACSSFGLHACLNLHRAPGFCINNADREKHNLWRDEEAQDAFAWTWKMFAQRYKGIPSERLSFDLVNEPCNIPPTHLCTRADHERVIRRTIDAIRSVDPDRQIVIDGFNGGSDALPELADVGAIHSGRGYHPFEISHFKAGWTDTSNQPDDPDWPLTKKDGSRYDLDSLREHYRPWREVEAKGVPVHIGEFGCFNIISNTVAMKWFSDLIGLFREYGWGYSLWNFNGAFGIVDHGRPDTKWENYKGYKVDREMLEIYKSGMIG